MIIEEVHLWRGSAEQQALSCEKRWSEDGKDFRKRIGFTLIGITVLLIQKA